MQLPIFLVNYQNLRHQTEYILFLMLFAFKLKTNSIYLQSDLQKYVNPTLHDVFSSIKILILVIPSDFLN